MNPQDLHQALQALPPTPPTRLSADDVIARAAGAQRRRRLSLLTVAGFCAAGLAGLSALQERPTSSVAAAAEPPAGLVVEGLRFERRSQEPFVLRPGVRPDDPLGLFVTVPATHVPDGDCAVHYEPVVAMQRADRVTIATWSYTPPQTGPGQYCAGVGRGDRTVRLELDEPLDDRPLLISGREGPVPVLLLAAGPSGGPVRSNLAPAKPDAADVCLRDNCVTVTDQQLLEMSAAAVNSAQRVRPVTDCSDEGRTDNVGRTYVVRFITAGERGPRIQVPLGCRPLSLVGGVEEFALEAGGPDVVRIAYDQQISPDNQCLGIGGPSGGPVTKDYVGLALEQAQRRAEGTNNDVIRIAGRDGICVGIVRDHVINRVNVYLEKGIVTASKSF